MEFSELCERAFSVVAPRKLSETAEAGGVGAALETDSGNVYVDSRGKPGGENGGSEPGRRSHTALRTVPGADYLPSSGKPGSTGTGRTGHHPAPERAAAL